MKPVHHYFLALISYSLIFGFSAHAEDPVAINIDWNGGGSGDFEVGGNWTSAAPEWDGGAPGTNPATLDTVFGLGLSGGATISLNGNAEFVRLHREAGSSNTNQFMLQGNTMTLTSTSSALSSAIVIYPNSGAPSNTLIFDGFVDDGPNGGQVQAAAFNMQQANTSSTRGGALTLRNEVQLFTSGTSRTQTGFANIAIESGASWEHTGAAGGLNLSTLSFSSSTMSVSGPDSFYQGDGTVAVGHSGAADLIVSNNAGFASSTVTVGRVAGAEGEISVDGLESRFVADRLYVGGSDAGTAGGDGAVIASSAAQMQVGQMVLHYNDSENYGNLGITAGRVVLGLNMDDSLSGVASVFNPNSELGIVVYLPNQVVSIAALQGLVITDSIFNLQIDPSLTATVGDRIDLVSYDSLTGEFANFSEGDEFDVGGYSFSFSYAMDGNDMIGLTVIPEPATGLAVGLVALASLVVWSRRQRTRKFKTNAG